MTSKLFKKLQKTMPPGVISFVWTTTNGHLTAIGNTQSLDFKNWSWALSDCADVKLDSGLRNILFNEVSDLFRLDLTEVDKVSPTNKSRLFVFGITTADGTEIVLDTPKLMGTYMHSKLGMGVNKTILLRPNPNPQMRHFEALQREYTMPLTEKQVRTMNRETGDVLPNSPFLAAITPSLFEPANIPKLISSIALSSNHGAEVFDFKKAETLASVSVL